MPTVCQEVPPTHFSPHVSLLSGVGAETPTQIPHETTTTEAFPHQHAQTEKPSWECEGAAGDQRSFGCIPSLVKEEPSDLVVEWEMCEGSLLDQQEGQHGGARKGELTPQPLSVEQMCNKKQNTDAIT